MDIPLLRFIGGHVESLVLATYTPFPTSDYTNSMKNGRFVGGVDGQWHCYIRNLRVGVPSFKSAVPSFPLHATAK